MTHSTVALSIPILKHGTQHYNILHNSTRCWVSIMLSVTFLYCYTEYPQCWVSRFNIVMLSAIMLSVIMLNVVMLNVVPPLNRPDHSEKFSFLPKILNLQQQMILAPFFLVHWCCGKMWQTIDAYRDGYSTVLHIVHTIPTHRRCSIPLSKPSEFNLI